MNQEHDELFIKYPTKKGHEVFLKYECMEKSWNYAMCYCGKIVIKYYLLKVCSETLHAGLCTY